MESILLHPTYFPSIEQMAAIAQAKNVVFEAQDNYQKQTYRNRCYIAHTNGTLLLNIPIKHSKGGNRQKTKEVVVENAFPWQKEHWRSIQNAYRTSPFFEFYEDELHPFFTQKVEKLMDFNLSIFTVLTELIGIESQPTLTESYEKEPNIGDFRFLVDAKTTPKTTLDRYTQVLEAQHGWLPHLSVLDLLFNEGPNTLNYLESQNIEQ
ncbi:WbqC family protein [Marinirhabdus gelatinilytica]|uniref:WbqC-like protein n=1 Tax=Marinirhabdus gelatinilytica TaxID=1703343 RepID=A0A370QFV0_9FLAO|nr:WbqC family protein [Marinirhabdus gelatinilytica]RDK87248.1 WbqC-like protein [Marinirhabdus gelatinilytica]